jgi:hypothetical protein
MNKISKRLIHLHFKRKRNNFILRNFQINSEFYLILIVTIYIVKRPFKKN